ncbi:glycosyltransferase [Clostridium cellulovorans]|uniref:Glycosyl transferase family 2 n=2 Tax=Clostridium cellulovorans TaxID=1493 RepID=D9SLX4_CLOC7|nr:glycosyltransferase [Clostridium cellulovorans]ADL51705.1 glycosyl transferase family 2 [Clostridium cellulovorans 743B]BAV13175.1 glycosyltransferase [Clostridium cellulovorans]
MNNSKLTKTSIIIPCKNEGIYVKQTIEFLYRTEAKYISTIIVINDNSNDNCCEFLKNPFNKFSKVKLIETTGIGAAAARNLGATFAENSEILVFCDAHITMNQNWLNILLSAFNDKNVSVICPGIGHFSPASPAGYGQSFNESFETYWLKKPLNIKEVPLVPGGCMAIKKETFDAVDGFDRGFHSWGFEDVELSIKLWLFGYKIFVHPAVKVGHKFRKIQPYDVDLTEFHYNKLRMAFSHFNKERINKIVSSLHNCSNFKAILDKITLSDTYNQRIAYFKRRLYDDNWFFDKFNIPF